MIKWSNPWLTKWSQITSNPFLLQFAWKRRIWSASKFQRTSNEFYGFPRSLKVWSSPRCFLWRSKQESFWLHPKNFGSSWETSSLNRSGNNLRLCSSQVKHPIRRDSRIGMTLSRTLPEHDTKLTNLFSPKEKSFCPEKPAQKERDLFLIAISMRTLFPSPQDKWKNSKAVLPHSKDRCG